MDATLVLRKGFITQDPFQVILFMMPGIIIFTGGQWRGDVVGVKLKTVGFARRPGSGQFEEGVPMASLFRIFSRNRYRFRAANTLVC